MEQKFVVVYNKAIFWFIASHGFFYCTAQTSESSVTVTGNGNIMFARSEHTEE
jgi:hypothetical protein